MYVKILKIAYFSQKSCIFNNLQNACFYEKTSYRALDFNFANFLLKNHFDLYIGNITFSKKIPELAQSIKSNSLIKFN